MENLDQLLSLDIESGTLRLAPGDQEAKFFLPFTIRHSWLEYEDKPIHHCGTAGKSKVHHKASGNLLTIKAHAVDNLTIKWFCSGRP